LTKSSGVIEVALLYNKIECYTIAVQRRLNIKRALVD